MTDFRGDTRLVKQKFPEMGLIQAGVIEGYSLTHKFGRIDAPAAGAWSNIWDGGGMYPYKYTANIDTPEVSSLDNGDAGKVVFIEGIDEDFVKQTEEVVLLGITPVELVNSYMIIYRLVNKGNGTDDAGSLADEVSVKGAVAGADSGVVFAKITNGSNNYNQTQMALFVVPAGSVGIVKKIGTSNPDKNCQIAYRAKNIGEPFQVKRVEDMIDQTSQLDVDYYFDEKTIMDILCKPTAVGSEIAAWFDVIVITKEKFNENF